MHKANSHDTRQPGGAAAAAAAARAGGRIRTGRSSSRPGGRCSVCQSAPSACAARARSGARTRGGAGKRGGGGEQASGPRAARRTGDRQAGDGPESDRAQRSERADRRSAAADLEGVRSATVGVGGRPSCGEEGGRQVRVVRVALHQSSGTQVETEHGRRKPVGAGEAGEIRCEIRFAPKQVWDALGTRRKTNSLERGLLGRPIHTSRDYLCFRKRSRGPPLRRTSATG